MGSGLSLHTSVVARVNGETSMKSLNTSIFGPAKLIYSLSSVFSQKSMWTAGHFSLLANLVCQLNTYLQYLYCFSTIELASYCIVLISPLNTLSK